MWPFNTAQERQAEAMANILAENAYDRKLERATNTIKTILGFIIGIGLTFTVLVLLDVFADVRPDTVWDWMRGR